MQQQKTVAIIFVIILLVVASVALAVGAFYTENFKHPISFVYLSSGNKRIMQDCNLKLGNGYFKVHTLIPNAEFDVKIYPAGDDFTYTVDGETYSWLADEEMDLSNVFALKKDDEGFSVRCARLSMTAVLQRMYPEQTVVLPELDEKAVHFKLVVTSDNHSLTLSFCNLLIPLDSIELDPSFILF